MVVGCQPHSPAAFTPSKYSWYSFLLEAESTPGPLCDRKDFMSLKNPMTPAGIERATFRFVAQHLDLWKPAGYVMHQQFNIQQLYALPTLHLFCIYLRTNSDLCHLHHKLTGFCNQDEKCLQRGTDWVFKYSSLTFVFKGLTTVPPRSPRHTCMFYTYRCLFSRLWCSCVANGMNTVATSSTAHLQF